MSTAVQPWESLLGKSTFARLKNVGADSRDYRSSTIGLQPVNIENLMYFSSYLHRTGAQMLRMQLSEDRKKEQAEKDALKKRLIKLNRIVRKKIRAEDLDDELVGIIMDKEWDTSMWTADDIIAGTEALMLIFQVDEGASEAKKAQAILMLEKLVFRHEVASNFVKRSLDPLIAKAASKKYRGGQSGAKLEILYILHSCRDKFSRNFSECKFVERMCDLIILEAKLSATMIQHAFRATKDRRKPVEIKAVEEGFGSLKELTLLKYRALNERSMELRAKWNSMHWTQKREDRQTICGLRGPVHVGEKYMLLILDIILALVSPGPGDDLAQSNREDLVRSNGIMVLSCFVSSPTGPFAAISVRILNQVAKCGEGIKSMIHNGIARAVLKYILYVSKRLNALVSNMYLDAVNIIQRLGIHASGIYRARGRYNFVRPRVDETEETNYLFLLQQFGKEISDKHVANLLAPPALLSQLAADLLVVDSIITVRCLLHCFYTLSCSDCYPNVLMEVVAFGGRLMKFLVDRLEDSDYTIATYALSILLQLCTLEAGRDALMTSQLYKFISPYIITTKDYTRIVYLRALLVAVALCRQRDGRAYDPDTFPSSVLQPGVLDNLIFIDYLETLKQPPLGEEHNIVSLSLLPTDQECARCSSSLINFSGAMQLADYLCHPDDEHYFYQISWDKISSICAILEGISSAPETAWAMFSSGTVRFLVNTLNLSKFELIGKPTTDKRMALILSGVISSANCLANLCESDTFITESPFMHLTNSEKFFDPSLRFNTDQLKFDLKKTTDHVNADIVMDGFENMDIAGAVGYILSTLTTSDHNISKSNQFLQELAALSCANLLCAYAEMLSKINPNHEQIETLVGSGPVVVEIIAHLKETFGVTPRMILFLNTMCRLLASLTVNQAVAFTAVQKWNLFRAFAVHLPGPLSGMTGTVGLKSGELSYKLGLGYLPASYFDTLASICKVDKGKIEVLNGGYLRRALDKAHILSSELETPAELAIWRDMINSKRSPPDPSVQRLEIVACLKLIAKCAHFNSTSTGNAMDLIFSPSYDIVGLCKNIICIDECPRTDNAFVVALSTIAIFTVDNSKLFGPIMKHDILEFLHSQILVSEILPPMILQLCLDAIYNIACGPQSSKMTKKLSDMKQSLIRTARLVPSTASDVNKINFKIQDAQLGPGARQAKEQIMQDLSKAKDDAEELTTAFSRLPVGESSTLQHKPVPSAGHLGSYDHCGISNCGSLRFPGSPGPHGLFKSMSIEEMEKEKQKLPLYAMEQKSPSKTLPEVALDLTENDKRNELHILEVSRLSARDEKFRKMIVRNKAPYGFVKSELFDLNTLRNRGATQTKQEENNLTVDTSALPANNFLDFSSYPSPIMKTDSGLFSDDDLNLLEITRVNTAGSSPISRGSSRSSKQHTGSVHSIPSGNISQKSPAKVSSSRNLLPVIRTLDVQDIPELRLTRPPPPTTSNKKPPTAVTTKRI